MSVTPFEECIYLDTNILVSILIGDTLSEAAQDWIEQQSAAFAISEWTRAEVHAVIGLCKRKDELTAPQARAVLAEFAARAEQHLQHLPVDDNAAALAAEWLRNPDCNLRTNDAFHLAIAHLGRAAILATFDERFAKAAQKLRLPRMKIELIVQTPRRAAQRRVAYAVATPKKAGKGTLRKK